MHRVVLKSENYHMTFVNTLEDMCISEYQNRLMTYEMKENCRPLLLCVRYHCYAYPPILTVPDTDNATKNCFLHSSENPRIWCHLPVILTPNLGPKSELYEAGFLGFVVTEGCW